MPNSMLATRISSFEERCFFIVLYAPLVMHLIINVWIRDGKIVRENVLNPYEHSEMEKEGIFFEGSGRQEISRCVKIYIYFLI